MKEFSNRDLLSVPTFDMSRLFLGRMTSQDINDKINSYRNDDVTSQGSEAWKNHRKNCVTATDVAKVLNISPYETALQCWSRKLGLLPDIKENEAMRRGSELEPIALARFIKETGINFTPRVLFHSVDKWKMASLDGVSDCGKYAVEIKGSKSIYEKTKKDLIDEIYRCQTQWQMYILDIPMIYFMAYWDGDYAVMEIKRDDDFLNEIMPKIHEFYRMMMEFTPPPATDKDFVKRDDVDWYNACDNYMHAKHMREKYEEEENEHRKVLIRLADGQSCQGAGVRISKTVTKGRINYSSVKELEGIDLEKYRSPSISSWRFTETKE